MDIKKILKKEKGKIVEYTEKLLEVKDLHVYFPVYKGIFRWITGWIKAVEGVSFFIKKGEVLGIVGESGCGKSTLARTIVSLNKAKLGNIYYFKKFDNNVLKIDLLTLNKRELKPFRKDIQLIFQDPYSSLNPRLPVFEIVREPLLIHDKATKKEHLDRVITILKEVGLSEEHLYRYPHEFSGGQRQRICIARALITNPSIIIADEPVSALDVSVQAQVINLLKDLQEEFKASYIFISHDLAVVKQLADRLLIMYLGKIMEEGKSEDVYNNPFHPYTAVLLSAIPDIAERKRKRIILKGEVPSIFNKPEGCLFSSRCPIAKKICYENQPDLVKVNDRLVACFFPQSF